MRLGLSPGQTRKLENQGQSLLLYFLCTLLSHESLGVKGLGAYRTLARKRQKIN